MNGIGLLIILLAAVAVLLLWDLYRWQLRMHKARAERQHNLRVRDNLRRQGLLG